MTNRYIHGELVVGVKIEDLKDDQLKAAREFNLEFIRAIYADMGTKLESAPWEENPEALLKDGDELQYRIDVGFVLYHAQKRRFEK